MAATHLLDSDVCIDLLNRNDARAAADLAARLQLGRGAISVITHGEVYDGVLGSRDVTADSQRWRAVLRTLDVIDVTADIAEIWAAQRGQLRRRGEMLVDNDLIIAATALHFGLALVTRNERHFARIAGLSIVRP